MVSLIFKIFIFSFYLVFLTTIYCYFLLFYFYFISYFLPQELNLFQNVRTYSILKFDA
jgi:hypothetical protein